MLINQGRVSNQGNTVLRGLELQPSHYLARGDSRPQLHLEAPIEPKWPVFLGVPWRTGRVFSSKDTMSGGQGDDLIVGGRARDSASNGKVLDAWTRWKRNDSYADRAADVERILAAPVTNDAAVNELIGGSDLDYFFVTQGTDDDDVFSLDSGEAFGEI